MKENVDLTSDRTFSRVRLFNIGLHVFLNKKPWARNRCDSYDYSGIEEEDKIVATGNKSERSIHILCSEELSRKYCDKCGAMLNPWTSMFCYNLCRRCFKELEIEFGEKKPWT